MRSFIGDQYALFFLTLWILWTCFSIFNFYLFFKNKGSIYIRHRDPWLILCSALGQYAMMTSLTWKIVLLPINFPNMVDLWFLWGFIPLHFLPYPVRSMRFIIQYAYKKYQLKKMKTKNAETKNPFFDFLQNHPFLLQDKAYFILNWILMAVAIIWGITRNIKYPINHPGKYGAENTKTYYISCTVLLIGASFFLWLAIYFQKKTGEQLFVTPELITIGVLWLIFISLYIIFAWGKIGSFRIAPIFLIILCISSFLVSFGMPVQLAVVLSEKSKKILANDQNSEDESISDTIKIDSILDNDENEFQESEKPSSMAKENNNTKEDNNNNKNNKNKSTSRSNINNINNEVTVDENALSKYNTVEGLLEDEVTYDLLLDFSTKRMCEEPILFFKDLSEYKKCQGQELKDKFQQMVDAYITDNAPFHLNVLGALLKKIESQKEPDLNTFEPIRKPAMHLVKTEIFPNFKKSPELKKFIENKRQELIEEEKQKQKTQIH